MKRFFSIYLAFALLAVCISPLFFPSDAKAEQPPIHASDLEAKDAGTNYDALPDGGTATDSAAEAQAQGAEADTETSDPVAPPANILQRLWEWAQKNGPAVFTILIAFLTFGEALARVTPTEKDDTLFKWLRTLFSWIPNNKKGGGTHPPA